jgi:hypothetical protein
MPRRARIVAAGYPMHVILRGIDRAAVFFEDELSAELLQRLRDCTNGGFVLGGPRFERQIAAMLGRRTWKGSPGRPRKETAAGEQAELAL